MPKLFSCKSNPFHIVTKFINYSHKHIRFETTQNNREKRLKNSIVTNNKLNYEFHYTHHPRSAYP